MSDQTCPKCGAAAGPCTHYGPKIQNYCLRNQLAAVRTKGELYAIKLTHTEDEVTRLRGLLGEIREALTEPCELDKLYQTVGNVIGNSPKLETQTEGEKDE